MRRADPEKPVPWPQVGGIDLGEPDATGVVVLDDNMECIEIRPPELALADVREDLETELEAIAAAINSAVQARSTRPLTRDHVYTLDRLAAEFGNGPVSRMLRDVAVYVRVQEGL